MAYSTGTAMRLMKSEVMGRPTLSSWSQLMDYLKAAQGFETREQFRILFLDKKNRLVADELQQQGTVDHTPYDTTSILRFVTKRFDLPVLDGLAARDAALKAAGESPLGDLSAALDLPT